MLCTSIQIVTGVEVIIEIFFSEVCKILLESKTEGNILRIKGENFQ